MWRIKNNVKKAQSISIYSISTISMTSLCSIVFSIMALWLTFPVENFPLFQTQNQHFEVSAIDVSARILKYIPLQTLILTTEMVFIYCSLHGLVPRGHPTSKQRHDTASKLMRCIYDLMCKPGFHDAKNQLVVENKCLERLDSCLPIYCFASLTILFVLVKNGIRADVSPADCNHELQIFIREMSFLR